MVSGLPDVHDDLTEPLRAPVDDSLLARIVKRITQVLPDACVVLFGSCPCGQSTPSSDLDLQVIAQTRDDPLAVAGELYGRLRPREIAMDIVVLSPGDVRRRLAGFDPFLQDAVGLGRVLHGRLP